MDLIDDTINFEALRRRRGPKKGDRGQLVNLKKQSEKLSEEDTRCSLSSKSGIKSRKGSICGTSIIDILNATTVERKNKRKSSFGIKDRFINLRNKKTETLFRLHKISPDTGRDFDEMLKELKDGQDAWNFYYKERLKHTLIDGDYYDTDPCLTFLGKRRAGGSRSSRSSILSFNSSQVMKPVFDPAIFTTKWTNFREKIMFSTKPMKVLEAPGMRDDYYLNLLDWSREDSIAIGLDEGLFLWDHSTARTRKIFSKESEAENVCCVKFNRHDGTKIAYTLNNGRFHYLDINERPQEAIILDEKISPQRVSTLEWINENTLAFGSRNGFITIFDVRQRNGFKNALHGHNNEICSLKWNRSIMKLASGANDNLVNIWDMRRLSSIEYQFKHEAAVKALDWSPHRRGVLYSGGGYIDKTIKMTNVLKSKLINEQVLESQITGIICSEVNETILTLHGYPKTNMSLLECMTLDKITEFPGHSKRILFYGLSPDKKMVATGSNDETVRIWDCFKKSEEEVTSSSSMKSSLVIR